MSANDKNIERGEEYTERCDLGDIALTIDYSTEVRQCWVNDIVTKHQ